MLGVVPAWENLIALPTDREESRAVSPTEARRALRVLCADLRAASQKDSDQELVGRAVDVVEEVLNQCKALVAEDPVAARIREAVSVEAVIRGERGEVRAFDMLVIANQLAEALDRKYPPQRGAWVAATPSSLRR